MGTAYAYVTRGLPNPSDLASRPLAQVTQIYDRTGQTLLYEFYEERRINIPLKDVSETMLKATLAAEDVNFYQHTGFRRPGPGAGPGEQRPRGGHHGGLRGRWLDDHPAAGQAHLPHGRAELRPQAAGDRPGGAGGAPLPQGADPGAVPQPGLLREPGLRGRGGGALLLRQARQGPEPRRGLAAGGPGAAAQPLRPGAEPQGGAGPAERRAGRDGALRAGHRRRRRTPPGSRPPGSPTACPRPRSARPTSPSSSRSSCSSGSIPRCCAAACR